jgi:hypothetical protein
MSKKPAPGYRPGAAGKVHPTLPIRSTEDAEKAAKRRRKARAARRNRATHRAMAETVLTGADVPPGTKIVASNESARKTEEVQAAKRHKAKIAKRRQRERARKQALPLPVRRDRKAEAKRAGRLLREIVFGLAEPEGLTLDLVDGLKADIESGKVTGFAAFTRGPNGEAEVMIGGMGDIYEMAGRVSVGLHVLMTESASLGGPIRQTVSDTSMVTAPRNAKGNGRLTGTKMVVR